MTSLVSALDSGSRGLGLSPVVLLGKTLYVDAKIASKVEVVRMTPRG